MVTKSVFLFFPACGRHFCYGMPKFQLSQPMRTRPAEPIKTRPLVDFWVQFWALRDPSIKFLEFVDPRAFVVCTIARKFQGCDHDRRQLDGIFIKAMGYEFRRKDPVPEKICRSFCKGGAKPFRGLN
jgi:hypothetical protein